MHFINRIFIAVFCCGIGSLPVCADVLKEDLEGFLNIQEIHAQEYSSALAHLKSGAYADAQTEAEQLITNSPEKYPGHLLLVLAYLGREDFVAIEQHLRELGLSIPQYVPPLRENLFRVLRGESRYFRALSMIEKLPLEQRSAQLDLDVARVYLAQSNYEDASRSLSRALEKNAALVDAHYEQGRIHLLQSNYQLALNEFAAVAKAGKSSDQLHQLIGTSYLGLGKYQDALKSFNEVIKNNPEDVLAQLNSGIVQLYLNNNEPALAHLLASQKKDKTADSVAGQILALVGLNKKADVAPLLAELNTELAADALVQLAALSVDGAAVTPAAAEAIGKIFPDIYFVKPADLQLSAGTMQKVALAALLYKQGMYLAVEEIYGREKSKNPHPWLTLVYARAQIKTNQSERAIATYVGLEREYPMLVSPKLELAEAYYHQQKYAAAIEIYKSLPLESNLEWQVQLGNLYNANEQYELAIKTYSEALAIQKNPYIVNQIAATYSEKLEQPAKAIKYIDEAKITQESPLIWDTLGWAYFNVDELSKSVSTYKQLLASTGNNQSPETFSKMARAYEKNGDIKQSRILYEMALNTGHDFEGAALSKDKLAELDARPR